MPDASGSPSLPRLRSTGIARQTQTASGASTLPKLTALGGILQDVFDFNGNVSLQRLVTSAVGIHPFLSSGASRLPKLISDGVSVITLAQYFTAESQILELVTPLALLTQAQRFTTVATYLEWVSPKALFIKRRNLSLRTSPSHGVFIHSPWWPYERIRDITHLVSNIDRSYERMAIGHCTFTMPRQMKHVSQGNIVVITSQDQPTWAGPIFVLEDSVRTGVLSIHALDMTSLLARRITPTSERYKGFGVASGYIFRSLITKMNSRGATGITLPTTIDPGPTIYDIEVGGQTILNALDDLHDRTDWEWWLEVDANASGITTTAKWGYKQGVDLSQTVHLWYGHNLKDASLVHDLTDGKQASIVIGGFGKPLNERSASVAWGAIGPQRRDLGIYNQLAPELVARTIDDLPAALRDERLRMDVMTANATELIRQAQRDEKRKLAAEAQISLTVNNLRDRSSLAVGNAITLHAPLGLSGELDGAVRITGVQPDEELGEVVLLTEVVFG